MCVYMLCTFFSVCGIETHIVDDIVSSNFVKIELALNLCETTVINV